MSHIFNKALLMPRSIPEHAFPRRRPRTAHHSSLTRTDCAAQGPAAMQPWECDGVIECGSVVVRPGGCPRSGRTGPRLPPGSSHTLTRTLAHRPGDAIIGDQDGVVCIPAAVAEKVYELAHHRETIEGIIKEELVKNPGPPGKYYPFKPPIKPDSPLGKLLTSKGVKFQSE